MNKFLHRLGSSGRTKDVLILALLFVLALSIRLGYQSESKISNPVRADAAEYFFSAYNYYTYGVYNPFKPIPGSPPEGYVFRRQPGYPMFLYGFFPLAKSLKLNLQEFTHLVATAQAVIGSLTVVFAYLFARLCLSRLWAAPVGLLTALSPHLVAMEDYMLTETLYTFILVLAALIFVLSWKKRGAILAALAGGLFGYAFLIHIIALLLGPFLGFLYILDRQKLRLSFKASALKLLLIFMVGFFVVAVPFIAYKKFHKSASHSSVLGPYSAISYWSLLVSTDINLEHFLELKEDPAYREMADKMSTDGSYAAKVLWDRIMERPLSQLRWFLFGKLFYLWRWDSFYVGDVYQYPMIRKGFEVNSLLKSLHSLMRALHWPLFILTLLAPVMMVLALRGNASGGSVDPLVPLLVPLLIFIYYYCVLLLKAPLPRYGIPLRPFSYVLAMWGLRGAFIRAYELFSGSKVSVSGKV